MAVDPNNIKRPHVTAPLYITKLLIFNEELKVNEKGSPLTNSIIYTDEVHLNHDQNSIGFEFASLSYSSSSNYKYSYKLENFDKDWTITNDNRFIVELIVIDAIFFGKYLDCFRLGIKTHHAMIGTKP